MQTDFVWLTLWYEQFDVNTVFNVNIENENQYLIFVDKFETFNTRLTILNTI